MTWGTQVEAVLFGAGRALSASELAEGLSAPEDEVLKALQTLQSTVRRRRGGALRVVQVGSRWSMEVKPAVAEEIARLARPELPQKLLSTAALIAYHQPIMQAQLVDLIGPKAYDHVRELARRGLIERRRQGQTRRLQTTPRFSEYFGCPYTDRAQVREWIQTQARSLGLTSRLPDLDEETLAALEGESASVEAAEGEVDAVEGPEVADGTSEEGAAGWGGLVERAQDGPQAPALAAAVEPAEVPFDG